MSKRLVFSLLQNVSMEGVVLTLRGKPFQVRGAATLNALDAIIVLVLGLVSNSLSDDRNDLVGS